MKNGGAILPSPAPVFHQTFFLPNRTSLVAITLDVKEKR